MVVLDQLVGKQVQEVIQYFLSANLSKLNSAFSSCREEELSHHSISSTPLVTDKESQGEKGKLMSALERLLVEVLTIAL